MEITYHGHSCFRLKAKNGIMVMDPYDDYIGLKLPALSADVVSVSHDHKDHNAFNRIKGTSRRKNPFIIEKAGAYEVEGISVFGISSFHDENQGVERGENTIFTVLIDDVRICHLGDLGHELSSEQVSKIGVIDVLFCPVGGQFTIGPKQAVKVINSLEPSYVIPMHYNTSEHNQDVFSELANLETFLKEYGSPDIKTQDSLRVEKGKMPEETILITL